MATVKETYLGNLRVQATHLQSGTIIETDAPTDNQGKGERFSPTDLCVTALGACALTIMGIYAESHGIDITGTEVSITKTMASSPRRIASITVILDMPDRPYTEKEKISLQRAAMTCPVHASLHPDIQQDFQFRWKD